MLQSHNINVSINCNNICSFHLNRGDINGLRQNNVICLVDDVLFLDAKYLEKLYWARVLAGDDKVVLEITILLSQPASL